MCNDFLFTPPQELQRTIRDKGSGWNFGDVVCRLPSSTSLQKRTIVFCLHTNCLLVEENSIDLKSLLKLGFLRRWAMIRKRATLGIKHRWRMYQIQLFFKRFYKTVENNSECCSQLFTRDWTTSYQVHLYLVQHRSSILEMYVEKHHVDPWNTGTEKVDCVCLDRAGKLRHLSIIPIGDARSIQQCTAVKDNGTSTQKLLNLLFHLAGKDFTSCSSASQRENTSGQSSLWSGPHC